MTQLIDAVKAAEQELQRQREALAKLCADQVKLVRDKADALGDSAGLPALLAAGEGDGAATALQIGTAGNMADGYAQALAILDSKILVQVENVRQAELALLGARVNAGAGGLLTAEQIAEKVARAREQVDPILFALADDLEAHNDLLESLYLAVKEATPSGDGGGVVPSVSLPNSDPSNHSIISAHGTYSGIAVSARLDESSSGSYYRWKDDRNADAIAAQRAEEQREREDRDRHYAEMREAREAEERRPKDGQQPNPGKPLHLDGQ